ncbi:UDP-N-acetylglucosamine--N-acetylmuramyl-(pentapeptide) pyrophosphoryl-undecaprenol N-acetylglucosamine transferase [Pelagibacterales bacterium SAG-MED47]|nr:UDP-N-acetylglucosamine--N-acetylmuramyl-(pentapeptide) pyrophosphoryl-undecaprenol N-acetylglucosamine transferase [Pelagibacterales bacterium SAG-MED47]
MKKNYLITTGGSGGHVIPATILFEHLSKKNNLILSTDKRGLKYLDKDIYEVEIVDTPKLGNIILLPYNLIKILFLIFKSFFLLKKKKIEKIFSTGGYMSIPIILAAKILNLEIYLVEPNQVLGRANKFFLNYCTKILCYSEQIKNFPEIFKDKIMVINPLVREKIYKLNFTQNLKSKFNLMIIGGSQGANIFDGNLKNIIVRVSKKFPVNIFHQTNERNISNLNDFYNKNNVDNRIFTFDKNFTNMMKDTDLCITRAGASTLAELSLLNIPFIAVPLPTSKDNHQFENANFYKNNDCCWLLEQKNFEMKIEDILKDILNDKSQFLKKKNNLKKLNYQNTWINVNQKILKIVNEN